MLICSKEKELSTRDIVNDNITVMNPEELRELNAIAKADLLNRKTSRVAKVHTCQPRLCFAFNKDPF